MLYLCKVKSDVRMKMPPALRLFFMLIINNPIHTAPTSGVAAMPPGLSTLILTTLSAVCFFYIWQTKRYLKPLTVPYGAILSRPPSRSFRCDSIALIIKQSKQ